MNNPYPPEFSSNTVDYKAIVKSYTKKWPWFLASGLIALVFAFIFLRYQIPEYSAQAQIKIVDKNDNTQLSVFNDLGFIADENNSLRTEDEISSIKSRYNLIQVAKRLKLNIQYYSVGKVLDSELYRDIPIELKFNATDSVINNTSYNFYVDLVSSNTFRLSETIDAEGNVYKYGDSISTHFGKMVINLSQRHNQQSLKDLRLRVSMTPITRVAKKYIKIIGIYPEQKGSNILNMYLADPVQEKAQDILNELLTVYNENTILDKKAIADRTSNFINNRITNLYSELSSVDQTAADFKSNRGITNIDSQSNINLNASVESQQELQNTEVQLSLVKSLENEINYSSFNDYIPSGVGVTDPNVQGYIEKYNELVLQRKKLLESSGINNPAVVQVDQQLSDIKYNLKSSVSSISNNLSLRVNTLSDNLDKYKSNLYMAPKNDRALRDITRKQETKEALYLYLLQKREESQIAYASTESNIKIIDTAYSTSKAPIGMDRKIVYLGAFLAGLMVPFLIIYLISLLDTKIHTRKELEKLVGNIPVLGEIPLIPKKQSKLIVKNDYSILAESLRILRTNLDYMIKANASKSKTPNVIYITSSISGEGKSFVALNLASIIAQSNAKVLLIEADIRDPKFYKKFPDIEKNKIQGLTEYLYNDTISIEDSITTFKDNKLKFDTIFSGKIPPNPTDLLMSKRLGELLSKVSKDYDYVIVDTAPLVSVADTLLISEYANIMLYTIKANSTESKILEYPLKLKEEGKLDRLAFVLNSVKDSDLGYGGKYGYGYGRRKKKWWNFI